MRAENTSSVGIFSVCNIYKTAPIESGLNSSETHFEFACPSCRTRLYRVDASAREGLHCDRCGEYYGLCDGIWRFLPKTRMLHFDQFLREYEIVRVREGRRADPQSYSLLPYGVADGPFREQWRIRAKSYGTLISRVLHPLRRACFDSLNALDLGAGHCWLSHRLTRLGSRVAAVDLLTNDWDGLGAHRYYPTRFTPIQAEFDRLPFPDATFHLAIFNGSFTIRSRMRLRSGKCSES